MKKLPVLARLKEHAADIASVQSSVSYVVEGNMSSTAIPAGKFFQLVHSTVSGRSDGAYTASKAITANTAIDASYFNESSPIAGGITNSIQGGGGGTGTVTGASLGSVNIAPDSNGILNFPVDASPTEDSNSLLTSGRIYTEIEQINDRIDNLDPELPSTVFSDVNFSITTNDWILNIDTGLYNASVTNTTLLTATSGVQIFYDSSYRTALTGDIYITKYTGYVTFTTDSQPSGTLTGFMRIIDSVSGIVPVSRGGTGEATPRQARENLNTPIRDIFVDFGTVTSLPQTVYDADLRANMVAFDAVFSNPGAIPNGIDVTFADPSGNLGGSVTITGTIASGASTTISFWAHEKRTAVEGSETSSETQRVQDFVQTNAQTLTAAQKTQALSNIGGASAEDVTALSNSLQTVEVQLTGFNSAISDYSRLKAWKYGKVVTINGYFSINANILLNAVLFNCPYHPNNLSVGHLDKSGNVGQYYPIYINDASGDVVNNSATMQAGSYDVNITFICK